MSDDEFRRCSLRQFAARHAEYGRKRRHEDLRLAILGTVMYGAMGCERRDGLDWQPHHVFPWLPEAGRGTQDAESMAAVIVGGRGNLERVKQGLPPKPPKQ